MPFVLALPPGVAFLANFLATEVRLLRNSSPFGQCFGLSHVAAALCERRIFRFSCQNGQSAPVISAYPSPPRPHFVLAEGL